MEIDEILGFALSLPETEESFPFGPDLVVLKTKGKIFIILNLASEPLSMNYKASPEDILEQRETYNEYVFPGYHMNKKHWNTLHINRYMQAKVVQGFIKQSYHLVRKK
jgi:predicted DNA-binding protein (MmcQ/YjbR family)